MMIRRLHQIAPAVALLLLGLMLLAADSRPGPEQAIPFHNHAAAAVRNMPQQIGPWRGTDVEMPQEAVDLLQPNAMRGRAFLNPEGERVTFLVVQTRDARDLAGHYPPNCYPANGWEITNVSRQTWQANGRDYTGRLYDMKFEHPTAQQRQIVANFMVMPDGQVVANMDRVRDVAADYTRRFFGAAQVQIILPGAIAPEQRSEIIQTMLRGHAELLQTLGSADPETDEDEGDTPSGDPEVALDRASAGAAD